MNSNYTHYVQYLFNNYQVTDELRAYLRWYHMWIDHMIDYDRFQYDTTYNVEQLMDEYNGGELLSTSEILEKVGESGENPELVQNRLRRAYRGRRR